MADSRREFEQGHEHEFGKPGWFDWLSRVIARVVYRAPRFAPSRFKQKKLMKQWASLGGEAFEVETKDGVRIHAMRFGGIRGKEIAKPRAAGGMAEATLPVVFAHGWTEIKEYHHRLARLLTSRGHDFVIYDQRAHGQSKAKFSTLGVREPDDLAAVIDTATQRGWLGDRFILMGVSMGGATVLRYAASIASSDSESESGSGLRSGSNPRVASVAGVVAYAPFASFVEANRTFKQRIFKFAASNWVIRGAIGAALRLGFDIRKSAPIEIVDQIKAPILYIVGEADRHLPAQQHAEKLAAVTDSEVVIVPEATHFDICFRPWDVADEAMLRFIDNCVGQ